MPSNDTPDTQKVQTTDAQLEAFLELKRTFDNFCEPDVMKKLKEFDLSKHDAVTFVDNLYKEKSRLDMIKDGLYSGILREHVPALYSALQRAAKGDAENPENKVTKYVPSYNEVKQYRKNLVQEFSNGRADKFLSFIGTAAR